MSTQQSIPTSTDPGQPMTTAHFEEYVYLFTPGKGWEVRAYGTNYWADVKKVLETIEI